MKKLFVFSVGIFFALSISANSDISEEEYDQIVDYVNCMFTNKHIQERLKSKSNDENDKKNYQSSIKPSLDKTTVESHLSYKGIIDLLDKYKFIKAKKELVLIIDKNKDSYSENKSLSNLVECAIKIPENIETIDPKFIDEIKREIIAFYGQEKGVAKAPFTETSDELSNKNLSHQNKSVEVESLILNSKDNIDMNQILLVLAGSILSVILMCIFQKLFFVPGLKDVLADVLSNNEELRNRLREILKIQTVDFNSPRTHSPMNCDISARDIMRKLENNPEFRKLVTSLLQKEIEDINLQKGFPLSSSPFHKLESDEYEIKNISNVSGEINKSIIKDIVNAETQLPRDNYKHIFAQDTSTMIFSRLSETFKSGYSVYEIFIASDGINAYYNVVSDSKTVMRCMKSRDRMLDPVCEVKQISPHPEKIRLAKYGRLTRTSDGYWQIVEKLKITLS